ncbi:hypothetical protein K8R78_06920, partial [bacterium]|nr:hypothetical protein [bacterium]
MLSSKQTQKTITNFRRLLLFSGIFNIVLAAPLILPGVFAWYLRILGEFNALLNLGGVTPVPPTEGIGALLANTAGIDLVLIGVIVIYASRKPLKRKGIALLNACGRTLLAFIVGYYCFAQ